MTYKEYNTQIEGLSFDKPNVCILVIQASNPDGANLTRGQMDAALGAAAATLEVVGAEVNATFNALQLEPYEGEKRSWLRINVSQEIEDDVE